MRRPENYSTRQSKAILAYIASVPGEHLTAAYIAAHFGGGDMRIGRTTVYRHLDRLSDSGKVRRYTIDGVSGACYQYVGDSQDCRDHFHLKCEDCGELLHLQCDTLDALRRHVMDSHDFEVNSLKTVFYGKCRNCKGLSTSEERN